MNRNSLFLSRLPSRASRENIHSAFQQFGEISYIRYRAGNERGLVIFVHPEDAQKAVKHFRENTFLGTRIKVVFNSVSNNKNETPQNAEEITIKELDNAVAKDSEILEILRTSWEDFSRANPRDNFNFTEISHCLDKIPYEMALPSFQKEIERLFSEG